MIYGKCLFVFELKIEKKYFISDFGILFFVVIFLLCFLLVNFIFCLVVIFVRMRLLIFKNFYNFLIYVSVLVFLKRK